VNVFRTREDGVLSYKLPEVIESIELVPGDVIEIPNGMSMPCDIILLNGKGIYPA
jgi:magnesium-transporting ATPase (P-type)